MAAARALGKIGTAAAAEALLSALTVVPAKVRPAVADGCLACAETFLDEGKRDAAASIYDRVGKADQGLQNIERPRQVTAEMQRRRLSLLDDLEGDELPPVVAGQDPFSDLTLKEAQGLARMLDNVVEINGLPLDGQRDEILRKIVAELSVKLGTAEQVHPISAKARNPEAYLAMLRGHDYYRLFTPEDLVDEEE